MPVETYSSYTQAQQRARELEIQLQKPYYVSENTSLSLKGMPVGEDSFSVIANEQCSNSAEYTLLDQFVFWNGPITSAYECAAELSRITGRKFGVLKNSGLLLNSYHVVEEGVL